MNEPYTTTWLKEQTSWSASQASRHHSHVRQGTELSRSQ